MSYKVNWFNPLNWVLFILIPPLQVFVCLFTEEVWYDSVKDAYKSMFKGSNYPSSWAKKWKLVTKVK